MLEVAAQWGVPPTTVLRLKGKGRVWYYRQLAWNRAKNERSRHGK